MLHAPVLEVTGLTKSFYVHEQEKLIPSSAEVRLRVYPGELTALIGPTGSGKSTVLKAIFRTYLPSRGRILYRSTQGQVVDLARINEHAIIELRKNEIRIVTQFLQFLPRQQTLDVVAAPLARQGLSREQRREKACRLLERLGIPERLWTLPPSTFSGGERQRVNLARGIISQPRLLLLDEPTASLDHNTTMEVTRIIEETKSSGTGVLAVFHDMSLVQSLAEHTVALQLPADEALCPN